MAEKYVIIEGKLVRTNPFCPRCGSGVFLADKGEWWACGKCGDRYSKSFFRKQKEPERRKALFEIGQTACRSLY